MRTWWLLLQHQLLLSHYITQCKFLTASNRTHHVSVLENCVCFGYRYVCYASFSHTLAHICSRRVLSLSSAQVCWWAALIFRIFWLILAFHSSHRTFLHAWPSKPRWAHSHGQFATSIHSMQKTVSNSLSAYFYFPLRSAAKPTLHFSSPTLIFTTMIAVRNLFTVGAQTLQQNMPTAGELTTLRLINTNKSNHHNHCIPVQFFFYVFSWIILCGHSDHTTTLLVGALSVKRRKNVEKPTFVLTNVYTWALKKQHMFAVPCWITRLFYCFISFIHARPALKQLASDPFSLLLAPCINKHGLFCFYKLNLISALGKYRKADKKTTGPITCSQIS